VPVDAAALKAWTHHRATYYQLGAFLDEVHGRGPVQVTAADGLRAVIIGAARERRVVRTDEDGWAPSFRGPRGWRGSPRQSRHVAAS
jgi:myo-inositol 2-dehydrogenase / D-chiro-inositol 1-dehydrogenase